MKVFTRMGSRSYEQLREQPQSDVAKNLGHVGDDVAVILHCQSGSEGQVLESTEDSQGVQRSFRSSPIPAAAVPICTLNGAGFENLKGERGPISSSGLRGTCSTSYASPLRASPTPETVREERRKTRRFQDGGGAGKGTNSVHDSSYDYRVDGEEACSAVNSSDGDSHSEEKGSRNAGRRTRSLDCHGTTEVDPPSRLIRDFLQRQRASGFNFLDLDMEMEELTIGKGKPLRPGAPSGNGTVIGNGNSLRSKPAQQQLKGNLVLLVDHDSSSSFDCPSPKGNRNSQKTPQSSSTPLSSPISKQEVIVDVPDDFKPTDLSSSSQSSPVHDASGLNRVGMRSRKVPPPISTDTRNSQMLGVEQRDPVLKSPGAYRKPPVFSRAKSRLADLPKPSELKSDNIQEGRRSGQVSGALRSGLLGKLKRVDEEEEDPLKDADMPEKYRRRDRGFWTIVQWVCFLTILGGLATILAFTKLREMKRGGLMLWKWALLVMVVFCGRLVAGWIIWSFVIIIEKNFLLRKRVLYFVYALRKGVQNCLWLGFALMAWHLMIDPKVDMDIGVVKYVTKILWCFLLAAVIVLVKTLIVKVFASSFHVSNYFERIQEALFNQYVMETLAALPMIEIEQNAEDERKFNEEVESLKEAGAIGPKMGDLPPLPPRRSGVNGVSQVMNKARGIVGAKSGVAGKGGKLDKKSQKLEEEAISVAHLTKLDQKNVSAWNMKRLVNIIRFSSLTHSLEETVHSEAGVQTEIQSEWQAKKAAKQIFKNITVGKGRKFITEDDLLRCMHEDEAEKAIKLFEGGIETKKITKKALTSWVINVYKERRSLAYSLNDTKTAVNKLHRIVDVIVGLIILVIWLLVLNIATTQLLLFFSSQFLLVILVWGNTMKTILEAIVFLFVMHPFDVGDRCVVDGQQLVVEEMNILTTVFLGDYNVKIWYPNSVLATKAIQNYYRSPEMGDSVEFFTLSTTPMSKINELKESIKEYLQSKPQWWNPEFTMNVMEMAEGKRMKLSLGVKHTMNYQDLSERFKRKSELLYELRSRCTRLEIDYKPPPGELNLNMRQEGTHEIGVRQLS